MCYILNSKLLCRNKTLVFAYMNPNTNYTFKTKKMCLHIANFSKVYKAYSNPMNYLCGRLKDIDNSLLQIVYDCNAKL